MKTSKEPNDLAALGSRLSIKFKNPQLLKNAFIHRSYLNEHKEFRGQSNERLEFLGDSVLSILVSRHLYQNLPKSPEGQLTQLRASLVRTETLAKIAQNLNLGSYLHLARGEEESGGRQNKTILANTFEALLGAIYLDQGLEITQKVLNKMILEKWQKLTKTAVSDHKSRLQEVIQRTYHQSPTYKLINTWGPDHDRKFEIAVYLADKELGRGQGKNKQSGAQAAARDALTRLNK